MKNKSIIGLSFLMAGLLIGGVSSLRADTRTWSGGNGTWSDPGNWSGGVPTSADTASFTSNGALTVSFTADAFMHNMLYSGGAAGATAPSLTFDLGGNTLTASSTGTGQNSAIVLTSVSGTSTQRTLNIQDGQLVLKNLLMATGSTQPMVNLNILDDGTMTTGDNMVAPSTYLTQIGFQGPATLGISSGGAWRAHSNVSLGTNTGGNGHVTVSGSGSSYNATTAGATAPNLWILTSVGEWVTGNTFSVQGGATAAADIFMIGQRSESGGTALVDGSSSSLTARRLYVGGGVNTNGSQVAAIGGTGTLTISNGGSVSLTDSQFSSVFAGSTIALSGGTLSTASTLTNAVNIAGGTLSGNGTVNGNVRLSGPNALSGTISGNGGTLFLNNNLEIHGINADTAGTGTIGSGVVSVAGTTTIRHNQTLELNGTLTGAGGMAFEEAANGTISGIGTLDKALSIDGGKTLTSTGTLTLGSTLTVNSGNTAGTSPSNPTIAAGTITVNGATTINASAVLVNNGTLAGTGNLTVTGTMDGTGSIDKTGGTISGSGTVGGLVTTTLSNGTISGGVFTNGVTASNSTINGGTYNGSLNLGGNSTVTTGGTLVVAGTLGVSGAGNTISAGTLSVAGATTINGGGALNVNGTLNGTGAVAVNGIIGGTGTVNKTVTVNSGGTLSPGNSPGTATYSSLSLNDGGNFNWQLLDATGAAGTGFDTIVVNDTLDLTGLTTGIKFNLNLWTLSSTGPDVNGDAQNFDSFQSQSWVLISAAGGITGLGAGTINDYFTINTAALNGTSGFSNSLNGGSFNVSITGSTVDLNYVAVPEPGITALMGLGASLLLYYSRRRVN